MDGAKCMPGGVLVFLVQRSCVPRKICDTLCYFVSFDPC